MQDMSGNPDVERRADTFKEEWVNEAVMRYFHNKLQQRRAELEQAINQKAWLDFSSLSLFFINTSTATHND